MTRWPDGVKTLLNQVDLEFFLSLPPEEILARACARECGGEPLRGKVGMLNVVTHRILDPVKWNGFDVHTVLLSSKQFSCFNPGDPNFRVLRDPAMWEPRNDGKGYLLTDHARYIQFAALAIDHCLEDVTGGALYYHADYLKKLPDFFNRMIRTCQIGRHIFYKEP